MAAVKLELADDEHLAISQDVRTWLTSEFLPASKLDKEPLRDALQHDFDFIFQKFAGPLQFLNAAFPEHLMIDSFANHLDAMFPRTVDHWDRAQTPSVLMDRHVLRPSDCSFALNSTIKPPTFQKVALALIDEFALSGFVSETEPLQVFRPREAVNNHRFQMHYIKGAARCHTAFAVLLYFGILKKKLNEYLPLLASSLHHLVSVNPLIDPSLEQIALKNAQLGQRGSIRRPLDVFSWVKVIFNIAGTGGDTENTGKSLIGRWNDQFASKDGKLTGNKRVAVLNLLSAPRTGLDTILNQVARLGAEGACATDDAMSNKKLFPGNTWRQFQLPNWNKLLVVTDTSFDLMCQMLVLQHESKPPLGGFKIIVPCSTHRI